MAMEKIILVVNPGSASKKFALYRKAKLVCSVRLEKTGTDDFCGTVQLFDDQTIRSENIHVSNEQYTNSVSFLIGLLKGQDLIKSAKDIHAIGIRIVAPGTYFQSHRKIDATYIQKLKHVTEIVPLHSKEALKEIQELKQVLPKIPLYGISDSAFHKTLPDHARTYAFPKDIAEKFELYRYGYHGISIASVIKKLKKPLRPFPKRIIVCHLGSGSSITALRNGKSIETSMGFSPLEGLCSGTRIGTIDASVLLFLLEQKELTIKECENFLNKQCGLLGLSGISADVRTLLEFEKRGDKNAKHALQTFIYQIQKQIGASIAILNGLDVLVFTGTMGERSSIIRERICANLSSFGIVIDKKKNRACEGMRTDISDQKSRIRIFVIPTDELGEMVTETERLFKQ